MAEALMRLGLYQNADGTYHDANGNAVPTDVGDKVVADVTAAQEKLAALGDPNDQPKTAAIQRQTETTERNRALGTAGTATGTTVSGKTSAQLEDMTKDDLATLAERKNITVTREDGSGEPLKADYVRALSATR